MNICEMNMVEDKNLSLWWECSVCGCSMNATPRNEKDKKYGDCEREILKWNGLYDDESRDGLFVRMVATLEDISEASPEKWEMSQSDFEEYFREWAQTIARNMLKMVKGES